jgi:hypothetical protein
MDVLYVIDAPIAQFAFDVMAVNVANQNILVAHAHLAMDVMDVMGAKEKLTVKVNVLGKLVVALAMDALAIIVVVDAAVLDAPAVMDAMVLVQIALTVMVAALVVLKTVIRLINH